MAMTIKGCTGFWVTDDIKPAPEEPYVGFLMPADMALLTLNMFISEDSITINFGDGTIKKYPIDSYGRVDILRYMQPNAVVKVYTPEYLTKLNVTDVVSFYNLDLCIDLTEVELDFVRMNTLTLPAEWTSLTRLLIEGYGDTSTPKSIVTRPEWTMLQRLEVSDGGSLTDISVYDTWTSLTVLNLNGCALTETTVNNILIALDNMGFTGTADLSGGTSASPTGAGITAYNDLVNVLGANIITN
jgi:hypothetical protein